jgi:hypothetical protein
MKLRKISNNETEIDFGFAVVFFSYDTPVAVRTEQGALLKTSYKHSSTTSRHINKWLNGLEAIEKDQSFFDYFPSCN